MPHCGSLRLHPDPCCGRHFSTKFIFPRCYLLPGFDQRRSSSLSLRGLAKSSRHPQRSMLRVLSIIQDFSHSIDAGIRMALSESIWARCAANRTICESIDSGGFGPCWRMIRSRVYTTSVWAPLVLPLLSHLQHQLQSAPKKQVLELIGVRSTDPLVTLGTHFPI